MAILSPRTQQQSNWKGYNGILPPIGWGQTAQAAPATNIVTPNTVAPQVTPPSVTQPGAVVPGVGVTPPTPITLENPFAPTNGGGGSIQPGAQDEDWLSYWRSTQPQVSSFGSLGGLGNSSSPMRYAAPESLEVTNDQGLGQMFSKWTDGRLDNLRTIQSTDVNSEAAERGYLNFIQKYGYDDKSNASIPNSLSALQSRNPWINAAKNGDIAQVGSQSYDLSNFIDTNRQSILGKISQDSAAINADIAAKQAAHQAMMASRQQNQLTQQQAYDGMLGNGANGLLTQAYQTPGFGQVTGQAAGANIGQQVGNSAALAGSGVFDPTIQSGVYGQSLVNTPWRL